MKKILSINIIILLLLVTSCEDDFLDRQPYHAISSADIWKTEANAEMAINGVYRTFAHEAWSHPWYYTATLSPYGYTIVRNVFGLDHLSGVATARDQLFGNMWRGFYRTVRYANDAITGLEGNENIDPEVRDRMIGEAKFFRGLSYFYLWQLWGGVQIFDGKVPVNETYTARNTAEEVRDFIIADFQDASEKLLLSYPDAQLGKVTKGAAIAMLGKTYLYDQQWEKAAAEFEKLMSAPFSYGLTAEYDDHFYYQTQNNVESVFEIQYISEPGLGSWFDHRFAFRNHPRLGGDWATVSHIGLEVFTNKDGTPIDRSTMPQRADYDSEAEYGPEIVDWYQTTYADADPRLHATAILPGSTFVGAQGVVHKYYWPIGTSSMNPPALTTTFPNEALIPIRKFVSPGEDAPLRQNSPVNYPLIRFADVLLMYAEAKNEASGPSSDVFEAINKVRSRAGVADIPQSLSQAELQREIRLERFRELMFESHGYFDVRRWRTAHTTDPIFGLNHEVLDFRGQRIVTKVFREEKDYLWPIPASEVDLNPQLVQNPGW
ncbi:RagB/SusD domain-containing protein [Flammeovirgaceae bacterium 311]|nr:RagB/SusD domain-containing protein [Flammeovirgaceae bacterium 311]